MKHIYKRIAAITAGVIITSLSIYSIILDDQRKQLENQVSGFYQESFEEIVSDLDSLKAKLNKIEAAGSNNQYNMLLMDVWRQTGDTEGAISALPVSYQCTAPLTQFMCRTGDYCRQLSSKLAKGETLSGDDMQQIRSLADKCGELSQKITDIWRQGYATSLGTVDFDFLTDDPGANMLDFSNQEFPRLIYDGPFSESTENKQPEGLGSSTVSKEDAQKKAGQFVGIDPGALTYSGDMNGIIASYGFSGLQNNIPFNIYISKQGGRVLWYMSQRDTGISAAPADQRYEQLKEIAKQYLRDKGYGDSAGSYAQFYGGMAVINLAPVENGVVLYPDLIKVWVDISANDVAGIDANNYLMSHKQRDIPAAVLTKEDAQAKLNNAMTVTNARLALIPLDTNEEKLCWEFTGTVNGNEFLLYINAETGAEEDILMIQDTNEGKLVM